MCGYCTDEKDGFTRLSEKLIPIETAGIRIETQKLEMGISRNTNNDYKLCAYYDVNGREIAAIEIGIEYCPFCGRKLY